MVKCTGRDLVVKRPGVLSKVQMLRLTFPRAKLRRQIFMTRAEVWAKNWAKFSAHFRASFAVQNDPQIFSQNSSQFITPCLVVEILKFLLRELLGFGAKSDRKREKGYQKVTEKKCEWPTPFCLPPFAAR